MWKGFKTIFVGEDTEKFDKQVATVGNNLSKTDDRITEFMAEHKQFSTITCQKLADAVNTTRDLERKTNEQDVIIKSGLQTMDNFGVRQRELTQDMNNHITEQRKQNMESAVAVQDVRNRSTALEKMLEAERSTNATNSQNIALLESTQRAIDRENKQIVAAQNNFNRDAMVKLEGLKSEMGLVAREQQASIKANSFLLSSISTEQKVLECEVKHIVSNHSQSSKNAAENIKLLDDELRKITASQHSSTLTTVERFCKIENCLELLGLKLENQDSKLRTSIVQVLQELRTEMDAKLKKSNDESLQRLASTNENLSNLKAVIEKLFNNSSEQGTKMQHQMDQLKLYLFICVALIVALIAYCLIKS